MGSPLKLYLSRLPRLPLAAFRRRLLLRAVFVSLLLGSAALALQLLTDEKQRLQRAYEAGFRGRLAVLVERLRHPSGQLALLNADLPPPDARGWVPLRLPLGAIDFDDPFKAERAVSLVDCWSRWEAGPAWCLGVGQRGSAGAFVYAVLRLQAPALQGRERGELKLAGVHRLRLQLQGGGEDARWLAPLELNRVGEGQWPGFAGVDGDELPRRARPDRDFRAWAWQDGRSCGELPDCQRDTLISLRIPVAAWRGAAAWPPAELAQLRLQLQVIALGGALLFDTQQPGVSAAAGLQAVVEALSPGERLRIARDGATPIALAAAPASTAEAIPWITRLVRRLPAARLEGPLQAEATIGPWQLRLHGDLGQVDRELAVAATRYSTTLLLAAAGIALAWLLVELGLLRRMAQLTRRANALTLQLQASPDRLPPLEVADLKGSDELGILAGTLDELLGRVREQLRAEQLRAAQAREQWQAVGHEIISPLQALLALHAAEGDGSRRYLLRMQAALNLLYGQASVGEAMDQAQAERERLDLAAFLREVAQNAPHAGFEGVVAEGCERECFVWADALKLEDALTHLLSNAQRYRLPGSPVRLGLSVNGEQALLQVHNQGPAIADERLPTLFELGTSSAEGPTQRGQGLFVARGYLAKMGGSIEAANADGGVVFTIRLTLA
jgi:signal transduction histidine kinase